MRAQALKILLIMQRSLSVKKKKPKVEDGFGIFIWFNIIAIFIMKYIGARRV